MKKLGLRLQDAHQHFAVTCFNSAWDYIEKPTRTADEEENMLQLAMASSWHWAEREDCTPQNMSVAYWQISRVHALCERGEEAVRYGNLCLAASQAEGVAPFALGYAYEALARGEMVIGNRERMDGWLAKANEVAKALPNKDTQKALHADLSTIH